MGKWYILHNGQTMPCSFNAFLEWSRKNRKACQIASTKVGKAEVSTVFLGLDHQHWRGSPPLLFETMIFGGPHDEYQRRYSTNEEAIAGHAEAVALAQNPDPPEQDSA